MTLAYVFWHWPARPDDYEDAIPAFVTMLVMPFTWSITNGIGAGVVGGGLTKQFQEQRQRPGSAHLLRRSMRRC